MLRFGQDVIDEPDRSVELPGEDDLQVIRELDARLWAYVKAG